MPEAQGTGRITTDLASGISQRAVGLAFGDTRTLGDLEIVPVAFVGYGFGGLDQSTNHGTGGGGGGFSVPLGVYVSDHGHIHFAANMVAVLGLIVPVLSILGLTFARRARGRGR